MKLLLVHHRGGLGGGERSLLNLIEGLDRNRIEMLLACPEEGRFASEARKLDVSVFPMPFSSMRHLWKLLVSAMKLARLVRTEQVDLIHGNAPQSNVPSGLAGRATGTPVVWQARVLLEPTMMDWERYLARLSSIIVCNSQAIRERFRSLRDYEKRTVAVLNGVDTKTFFPGCVDGASWRKQAGISVSERVIGCFDRLDPVKNHETILHACRNVFEDLGAGTLVVVGAAFVESDRRMQELKALAGRLGIAERVRFLGFVDDVRPAMAACDVVVHASLSEGCSRVLCEAQAMGLPVVASRVGGNPEVVRDGVSGYLYPASDAASLSQRVTALLSSEESRMEMGRQASEWAAQALARDRYCREIEQIYSNLSS